MCYACCDRWKTIERNPYKILFPCSLCALEMLIVICLWETPAYILWLNYSTSYLVLPVFNSNSHSLRLIRKCLLFIFLGGRHILSACLDENVWLPHYWWGKSNDLPPYGCTQNHFCSTPSTTFILFTVISVRSLMNYSKEKILHDSSGQKKY